MANYTGYKNDTLSKERCIYVGYMTSEKKVTDLYLSLNKDDIMYEGCDDILEIPIVERPVINSDRETNNDVFTVLLHKNSNNVYISLKNDTIYGFTKKLDDVIDIEKDNFYISFYCYHGYFSNNFMKNKGTTPTSGVEIDESLFSADGDCYISYKCYNQDGINGIYIDLSFVSPKLAFYNITIR